MHLQLCGGHLGSTKHPTNLEFQHNWLQQPFWISKMMPISHFALLPWYKYCLELGKEDNKTVDLLFFYNLYKLLEYKCIKIVSCEFHQNSLQSLRTNCLHIFPYTIRDFNKGRHPAICRRFKRVKSPVRLLLTDFVCLYNYEFWLSLCKIVRSSVILLLPLLETIQLYT